MEVIVKMRAAADRPPQSSGETAQSATVYLVRIGRRVVPVTPAALRRLGFVLEEPAGPLPPS